MGECLCIDSRSRGLAMPKAFLVTCAERVIEAVETGRRAARRPNVSVSVTRCLRNRVQATSLIEIENRV
jgi:hypothetical protein